MNSRFAFSLVLGLQAMASDATNKFFKTEVFPILEKRCMPCHFEGGKMYEKLPFDGPAAPRKLGERLFTRIKDPKEQETIRRFLAESKDDSGSSPKPNP